MIFEVIQNNWAENIVLKVTQLKKTFKLIVIKEVTQEGNPSAGAGQRRWRRKGRGE